MRVSRYAPIHINDARKIIIEDNINRMISYHLKVGTVIDFLLLLNGKKFSRTMGHFSLSRMQA